MWAPFSEFGAEKREGQGLWGPGRDPRRGRGGRVSGRVWGGGLVGRDQGVLEPRGTPKDWLGRDQVL